MKFLVILKVVLYYLLNPFWMILKWIGAILLFLGAPVVHLGYSILHGCMWPFRFLARFEVRTLQAKPFLSHFLSCSADTVHLPWCCPLGWNCYGDDVALRFQLPGSSDEA